MKYIKINFALCAIVYFFRYFFQKTRSAVINVKITLRRVRVLGRRKDKKYPYERIPNVISLPTAHSLTLNM